MARFSVVIVGLSHRTSPVEMREKLAFSRDELGEVASRLRLVPGVEEGVILSTCNRTEVLAAPRDGVTHDQVIEQVRDFLCATRSIQTAELDRHLYAHKDLEAVRHLFRVASSLDSMMIGEPQILGQVKDAWSQATQSETLGPRLHSLLQRAFAVAKRVRAGTQIARNPVSISYAAADLASRIFGSLAGRSVMILGAGKMADLAARHLITAGATTVYVVSRTLHHAQELARRHHGVAVTFDRLMEYLPKVDIVIASTAAPHHVLDFPQAQQLMKQRRGRPIFFIDIAVPRDIDPACNKLDNLYLYDIDDLQKVVDSGLEDRRREAVLAEAMVEEELVAFEARERAREASPTIIAMREKMQAMARDEMIRFRGRLGPLSEKQEAAIEEMVSALVNKLLHGPTRELKRAAGPAGGPHVSRLVSKMFDLGQDGEGEAAGAGDEGEPPGKERRES